MPLLINRRTFLSHSAALAAMPFLAQFEYPRETGKNVIVVGAGLAGLSAAYELLKLGHFVTVFEARSRPGGRVETWRDPFADGLYADVGATRIPDTHYWTMKYVREFRLKLTPFKTPGLADIHFFRGKRFLTGGKIPLSYPYELTTEEQALTPAQLSDKVLKPLFSQVGDPSVRDWPPPALARFDEMSLMQLLREQGLSEEASKLLTDLGLGAPNPNSISALFTLRNRALQGHAKEWYRIEGGNDQLVKAFASTLADRIVYNAPVERIEQDRGAVHVTYRRGSALERVTGDYAVCAVPLPLLQTISFTPALSSDKRRASAEVPRSAATKVFVQMRKRFWVEQGLSGFATTDLPIGDVWDLSVGQQGRRGLLVVYTAGPEAEALGAQSEHERISTVIEYLDKILSGVTTHIEGVVSKAWHLDPWARSAFAAFAPGQLTGIGRRLGVPEGRIHFAGDHASSAPAWMHGALESGNRAAAEIDAVR